MIKVPQTVNSFLIVFFPVMSISSRQRKLNILYTANDLSSETFYGN